MGYLMLGRLVSWTPEIFLEVESNPFICCILQIVEWLHTALKLN